jgi:hypothetical protein
MTFGRAKLEDATMPSVSGLVPRRQQRHGNGYVATRSRGYLERDGTVATIDNYMDFCRYVASRGADWLGIRPPFPPAADRWALAVVLPII